MLWVIGDVPHITVHYLDELPVTLNVEEDQQTLLKNAEKKAREISRLTDWYVLTSDGGVDIPGLKDKWDILRNQRIVGEDKTDKEKVSVLLSLMVGLTGEERACEHHFAVALAHSGEVIWSQEEVCETGVISEDPIDGEIPPYRWMGSLWYYPQFGKRELFLTDQEKEIVRETRIPLKKGFQEAVRNMHGTRVSVH